MGHGDRGNTTAGGGGSDIAFRDMMKGQVCFCIPVYGGLAISYGALCFAILGI